MDQTCLPAIVIHGGAWSIPEDLSEASRRGAIEAARRGYQVLKEGGSAVDAVQTAVIYLEDDPAFLAGTGSALNVNGEIEMDAMIMDGSGQLKAGSVAGVQNIKNPVNLARMVMDKTEHTMIVGSGANKFAAEMGIPFVSTESLLTEHAKEELENYKIYKTVVKVDFKSRDHDTVGACAVDRHGNVACATSTGGITAKRPGRVGDSPLIGCGGFADNTVGAVSTTGHGESMTKVCLSRLITFYMSQGSNAQEAADKGISEMTNRVHGSGGAIVISPSGDIGYSYSTERMAWAYVKNDQLHYGLDPGDDFIAKI